MSKEHWYVTVRESLDSFNLATRSYPSKTQAIKAAKRLKAKYLSLNKGYGVHGDIRRYHSYFVLNTHGAVVYKIEIKPVKYWNIHPASKIGDIPVYGSSFSLFDQYGNFNGTIPSDCVRDCSHPGPCDTEVKEWSKVLGFNVPRTLAINYLVEFGAWTRSELNEKLTSDLSEIVLWIACSDIKEEGEWLGLIH